ncbi:MAG: hypothetical protein F6K22_18330 [Okeania sp. SIO2F4]|uniref:hypothetical protein n=1 Tax=Okeania sp. SIO2F4 TaxID=2607790 RepID=UPI00142B5D2B|nr:hypothetical protein [Okeania sp. SIO2F4]NES04613.1 hypothetical protein [Okeania sp. SIO2F4]
MDKRQPPAHVLKAAKSLKDRDIQATKILYHQMYIDDLNSSDFYSDIDTIDVNFFEVDDLLSLPPSPPPVSSRLKLASATESESDEDIV